MVIEPCGWSNLESQPKKKSEQIHIQVKSPLSGQRERTSALVRPQLSNPQLPPLTRPQH